MSGERSKAEARMIRRFEKKGGKGFRVLRSAEAVWITHARPFRAAAGTPTRDTTEEDADE